MNKHFCDNSDNIASLYIDDMLEADEKRLFEAHLAECSQCRDKFDSFKNVVSLLRCSDELTLPEGFSENLHKRLDAVRENKKPIFIFNKKVIASLSAAAVLLFGVWIYSTMPYINGGKTSTADQMASSQAAGSEAVEPSTSEGGSTEIKADNQIKVQESSPSTKQEAKRFETVSPSTARSGSGAVTSESKKSNGTIVGSLAPKNKVNETILTFGAAADVKQSDQQLLRASSFTLATEDNQNVDMQYNLVCSEDFSEADKLRQAMLDLGAVVISNSTGSSIGQGEYKVPSDKFNNDFIASVEKQGQIKLTETQVNTSTGSSVLTDSSLNVNRFDIKKDYIIIKINYITK